MADFNSIASKTLVFEGGYQKFPNDSGNYTSTGKLVGTNRGISALAYEEYLGKEPTEADMRALTPEIAKAVYRKLFWDKRLNGDKITNQSVAWIFFDSLIQTGNNKLNRQAMNQVMPGVVQSGSANFNDYTVSQLNKLNQQKVFEAAKQINIDHRKMLAEQNPSKYAMFVKGWVDRINKINYTEVILATGGLFFLAAVALAIYLTSSSSYHEPTS